MERHWNHGNQILALKEIKTFWYSFLSPGTTLWALKFVLVISQLIVLAWGYQRDNSFNKFPVIFDKVWYHMNIPFEMSFTTNLHIDFLIKQKPVVVRNKTIWPVHWFSRAFLYQCIYSMALLMFIVATQYKGNYREFKTRYKFSQNWSWTVSFDLDFTL